MGKISKYGCFSCSVFVVLGGTTEIYSINVRVQTEYGKIRNKKNICTLFTQRIPETQNLLKVNNRNTRTRSEMCSKLTIMTPKWRQWELWANFSPCSSVSIVNFKQLIAGESARYVKIVYFNKFLSNAFLKSFTTISLFVTDLLNQDWQQLCRTSKTTEPGPRCIS